MLFMRPDETFFCCLFFPLFFLFFFSFFFLDNFGKGMIQNLLFLTIDCGGKLDHLRSKAKEQQHLHPVLPGHSSCLLGVSVKA